MTLRQTSTGLEAFYSEVSKHMIVCPKYSHYDYRFAFLSSLYATTLRTVEAPHSGRNQCQTGPNDRLDQLKQIVDYTMLRIHRLDQVKKNNRLDQLKKNDRLDQLKKKLLA